MTILHIASPFAVSAPVSASASPNGDRRDGQREPSHSPTVADGQNGATARDGTGIDASDARLAARTVDLAAPSTSRAATAGSLDAVLAAYGEAAHRGVRGDPIDDGDTGAPASLSL